MRFLVGRLLHQEIKFALLKAEPSPVELKVMNPTDESGGL